MRVKNEIKKVTIVAYKGRWRLRLPRSFTGGEQVYLYSGLIANSHNLRIVQPVALQIESDVDSGCFDISLERYKQAFWELKTGQKVQPKRLKSPNLLELWAKYCDYKQSQVTNSTFQKDFLTRYSFVISKLPTQDLRDASKIFEFVSLNYPAYSAKRLMMQFSACCRWAVKTGFITQNPFYGMSSDIRAARYDWRNIDVFKESEVKAIIEGFRSHTLYSEYTDYVKFLFLTGCRPGEVNGLRWKQVSKDCKEIFFNESYSKYGRSTTKTGVNRKFPCNCHLENLLLGIRPKLYRADGLVFPSPVDGYEIKSDTFVRIWKSVLNPLIESGLVSRYRKPMTCRHTFISRCLESGITPQQVALWVGNSPQVIFEHYAGISKDVDVPVVLL
ncbi:site-specific integrase [Calothrix sp. UHCC 0171]|uniref:site-specific integrase n=1 Tax=Calothrix sp. UHCC 0171 TaxID=3110245 RepID=UPI002B1F3134|nr:tyrosine-type recombinase/integrase [Calothrix sp. UHCC 0171]MEA5574052.1 tyrosine-type recombinase/integrase [Calothrix sp. UHCC 0171]